MLHMYVFCVTHSEDLMDVLSDAHWVRPSSSDISHKVLQGLQNKTVDSHPVIRVLFSLFLQLCQDITAWQQLKTFGQM